MIRRAVEDTRRICAAALLLLLLVCMPAAFAWAESPAHLQTKEIKLPYAFYNEGFGGAVGYVYGAYGYPQPHATLLGTVIAGSNDSLAFYFLERDICIPYTRYVFVDCDLALSTFGTIKSYASGNPEYPDERAGSNDSDKNNYIKGKGDDNLVRVKFKYLLPIGAGAAPTPPLLDRGLPVEGSAGGDSWNPLRSGKTFLELRPFWREQTISTDAGDIDQKTNGLEFSLYRDNTDFGRNPSRGESGRLRYVRDWGWGDSSRPYAVADAEVSKYFSLGATERFRQRVIAFDFWTVDALSWDETSTEDGQEVYHRPPPYNGATLGGLWRMRAYPTSRFNDQAALYYALEYRLVPQWNPFAANAWVKEHLDIEWWQWVAFVEAGRVAPAWTIPGLHKDMQWDAGVGVRAMAKGIVVRVDIAGSREGAGVGMMVGQPFPF